MLWQILLLPMSSVYKSVVISVLLWLDSLTNTQQCVYTGPCGLFFSTAKEYHLYHVIFKSIHSGSYVSIREWKRRVRSAIWDREKFVFTSTILIYKSIKLISSTGSYGHGGNSVNISPSIQTDVKPSFV